MHRVVAVVLVLGILAAAAPAAAAPVDDSLSSLRAVAGRDLSVLLREGQPAVRHLSGRLTAVPATNVRAAADAFLARHAAALGLTPGSQIAFQRALPLRSGTVLRYRQSIDGIPVLYGDVALRFDGDGILRIANSGMRPFASIADPHPRIDAGSALTAALRHPDVVAPLDVDAPWMGLVYYPAGDEARLAWQVETGAFPALLANWTVWVDAHDGRVLEARNRVWMDRLADVFEENPVSTPDLVRVTFNDLPAWASDPYYLTSELVLARNCIDRHTLTSVTMMGMTLDVHLCVEEQVAAGSDPDHDFLFDDNADTAPEDLFAESQMFFHTTKVYDFFQGLGFGRLREVPLAATVNFRIPVNMATGFDMANLTNPNGELYPFDNAMFIPAGDMAGMLPRDTDSIVFGQGSVGDFAYDGDIVYHEFTHAVIDSTCGLTAATIDDQGLDNGPGSLNEGYADIFAMFLTEDPQMGEYGGAGLTGGGPIRSLTTPHRCPDDLIGETHEDSLPWSTAAWAAYTAYGEDLIQPYFDALVTLIPDSDFAVAVRDTLAEIRSQLGDAAAADVRAIYESNNLAACERVVTLAPRRPFRLLMGEGTSSVSLSPYVPGYLMFHAEVPAGQRQFVVTFLAQGGGMMGGTPVPHVLFRKGERLHFRFTGRTVEADEDHRANAAGTTGIGFEAIYCETDRTLDAGDYYFMVANAGAAGQTLQNIAVSWTDSAPAVPCVDVEDPDPDAGDAETDAGADVVTDATDVPAVPCEPASCDENCRTLGRSGGVCLGEGDEAYCSCNSSDDGCGCRAAGTASPRGTILGLLLVAGLAGFASRRRYRP
jgi:MYXO-CTERM domain-containing protein